jgi:hypothetical protein
VDRTAGVGPAAPAGPGKVEGARRTEAAARAGKLDAVGEVARRLRAGEVTVEQAVDLLIEDAIARQVGRAMKGRHDLEGRLRELLKSYTATDPLLAAKIRRLTLSK